MHSVLSETVVLAKVVEALFEHMMLAAGIKNKLMEEILRWKLIKLYVKSV